MLENKNDAVAYTLTTVCYCIFSLASLLDCRASRVVPCRISVYSEEGKTKIGMIKPKALLEVLSNSESLMKIAEEVEAITMEMIQEAK